MVSRHSAEEVFKIFSSGAIAGYLNQDYYSENIDDNYIKNFKEIIKQGFKQQADTKGYVELIFNRIFLVAVKE